MSRFDRASSAPSADTAADSVHHALTHWRATFDERLEALERALREPSHAELSALIVDFTRVAGEEAQAAARQACLEAESSAQRAADAADADRQALDETRAALVESRQLHSDARQALDATRRAHDESRRAYENVVRSLDEAQRAAQEARREAADARQQLADTVSQAQEADEERRELAGIQAQLQAQLEQSRAEAQDALAQVAVLREQLTAASAEAETRSRDLQVFRRRLEQAVHDAEQRSSAQESERIRLEQLATDASARSMAATSERDVARAQLTDVTNEVERLRSQLESAAARISGLEREVSDRDRTIDALKQTQAVTTVAPAVRTPDPPVARTPDPPVVLPAPAPSQVAVESRPTIPSPAGVAPIGGVSPIGLQVDEILVPHASAPALAPVVEQTCTLAAESRSDDTSSKVPEDVEDARADDPPLSPESTGVFSTVADALRAWTTETVASQPTGPVTPEVSGALPASSGVEAPKTPDVAAFDVVRQTVRHELSAQRVTVTIDQEPGQLVDLSAGGAQVVTSSMLKPGRQVRLAFPSAGPLATARAKIIWSRLEPPTHGGGELQYRAGLAFVKVDPKVLSRVLTVCERPTPSGKPSGR